MSRLRAPVSSGNSGSNLILFEIFLLSDRFRLTDRANIGFTSMHSKSLPNPTPMGGDVDEDEDEEDEQIKLFAAEIG